MQSMIFKWTAMNSLSPKKVYIRSFLRALFRLEITFWNFYPENFYSLLDTCFSGTHQEFIRNSTFSSFLFLLTLSSSLLHAFSFLFDVFLGIVDRLFALFNCLLCFSALWSLFGSFLWMTFNKNSLNEKNPVKYSGFLVWHPILFVDLWVSFRPCRVCPWVLLEVYRNLPFWIPYQYRNGL